MHALFSLIGFLAVFMLIGEALRAAMNAWSRYSLERKLDAYERERREKAAIFDEPPVFPPFGPEERKRFQEWYARVPPHTIVHVPSDKVELFYHELQRMEKEREQAKTRDLTY